MLIVHLTFYLTKVFLAVLFYLLTYFDTVLKDIDKVINIDFS